MTQITRGTRSEVARGRGGRVALALAVTLTAAACGGGGGADPTEPSSGGAEGGEIFISGSSTVQPISDLVAEIFSEENPDVAVAVDGPGTGDGFELFCEGQTDVSDASRAIDEEEAQACAENDVEYLELLVGLDGITVLTGPANEDISCLSIADLYALLGPESRGFENWAEANDLAAELDGTNAPYPDAPLVVAGPGTESGTYDFFVETVIEEIAEEREVPEEDWTIGVDYQASPSDNQIITNVQGSDSSLGWVGFAFYASNQDTLKAVEIDAGDGCVLPSIETIADGSYPISRPLYIYVNTDKANENPALTSFIDLYMSEVGNQSVADAGYVQLPPEDWDATVAAWSERDGA